MAALLDHPARVPPDRSGQLAARAIVRCLLGIGPVDRLLAIVDGASDDCDGSEAADRLSRLVSLFGWGALDRPALEVTGTGRVTAADLHRVDTVFFRRSACARDCSGELRRDPP